MHAGPVKEWQLHATILLKDIQHKINKLCVCVAGGLGLGLMEARVTSSSGKYINPLVEHISPLLFAIINNGSNEKHFFRRHDYLCPALVSLLCRFECPRLGLRGEIRRSIKHNRYVMHM